ncbi:hypothetical protein DL767_004075 [Monosporascus sp. MG133]|nr:hypothetical protein DL767_004075 [Monosporascus sp. MG133]
MVQLLSISVAGITLLVSLAEGKLLDLFTLGPRQEGNAHTYTYPKYMGHIKPADNGTSVIAERDLFGVKRQSCDAGYGYCSTMATAFTQKTPAALVALALPDRRAVTMAACRTAANAALTGATAIRETTAIYIQGKRTQTYYYYYWTYYTEIDASVVTSSQTTTTSYLTLTATDSAAAESIFEEFTATATFSPPASETSLLSLAGETLSSTDNPTDVPTDSPTYFPTDSPTASPTDSPTYFPTDLPTDSPTDSTTVTLRLSDQGSQFLTALG